MDSVKKETIKQPMAIDEENGMYVGIPILSVSSSKQMKKVFPWACCLLSSLQICLFIIMVSYHGVAPHNSNPFLGPPIEVIDAWGSKNPYRILQHSEYWRVYTAIFLSVGVSDLFFSTFVLLCLGYHLEKQWGSFRFLIVYIVSGIGGNIFGILTPAISVGGGGSIFGILGGMHVEMIYCIIQNHFNRHGDDDGGYKHHEESQEEAMEHVPREGEETVEINVTEEKNMHTLCSTLIVLGFLGGIIATTFMEIMSPDSSSRSQKDWNVLYGGMTSGMFVTFIWYLYISCMVKHGPKSIQIAYALVLLTVPFLFDFFFTLHQASKVFFIMQTE